MQGCNKRVSAHLHVMTFIAVVWISACVVATAQEMTQRQRPGTAGRRTQFAARQGRLQPGDSAPPFALQVRGAEKTVKLSDFHGKPVALVFGSYT